VFGGATFRSPGVFGVRSGEGDGNISLAALKGVDFDTLAHGGGGDDDIGREYRARLFRSYGPRIISCHLNTIFLIRSFQYFH